MFRRWRGRLKARYFLEHNQPLKLDIGCGDRARNGFVGLDMNSHSDICWDLTWGLPFPDNKVSEIRSDHCLEHMALCDVKKVLTECCRVLEPGAVLDFTVPHFDPYLDAYMKKDFQFLKEKIYDVPLNQEELYNTCLDRIAWLLNRNGEHKSIFDRESIIAKVKLAGFSHISTREHDPARDADCRYSSIYVVAVK